MTYPSSNSDSRRGQDEQGDVVAVGDGGEVRVWDDIGHRHLHLAVAIVNQALLSNLWVGRKIGMCN